MLTTSQSLESPRSTLPPCISVWAFTLGCVGY
eukprot:COSAG01_NODE_29515_length_635_cov_11.279851_2_plen_31_part_01